MLITLCGSARFEEAFKRWNLALTLAGHAVFSLAACPSDCGGKDWYDKDTKERLDKAHKRKIEASDVIVVLNCGAYIGESTLSEIQYARAKGKLCHFLESWGEGCGPYGGPYSPIKTFGGHGGHPLNHNVWATSLLGPGGAFRSSILLPLVKDGRIPGRTSHARHAKILADGETS